MYHGQGGETNPFRKNNSPNPVRTTRTLTVPNQKSRGVNEPDVGTDGNIGSKAMGARSEGDFETMK